MEDQDPAMSPANGSAKSAAVTEEAEAPATNGQPAPGQQKITIIVHSGDFDKMYSAFIIGNGALAMGMEASMYFTFWGLSRLKRGKLASGPLSKMHMMGLGKLMVKSRMRKQNVRPLDQLAQDFKELGGKIFACDMTMDIMGIKAEQLEQELIEEYCAVGTYIREARESTVTLFI
jgi:peroxiredoxin family protein